MLTFSLNDLDGHADLCGGSAAGLVLRTHTEVVLLVLLQSAHLVGGAGHVVPLVGGDPFEAADQAILDDVVVDLAAAIVVGCGPC